MRRAETPSVANARSGSPPGRRVRRCRQRATDRRHGAAFARYRDRVMHQVFQDGQATLVTGSGDDVGNADKFAGMHDRRRHGARRSN